MKKITSKFEFTKESVLIYLKINYRQKTYTLKTKNNAEAFTFVKTNKPRMHIALFELMKEAVAFAERELGLFKIKKGCPNEG